MTASTQTNRSCGTESPVRNPTDSTPPAHVILNRGLLTHNHVRHSHEFEVQSGMLICPKTGSHPDDEWEKIEVEAMKEIIDLYGKTWHFWQVDRGDKLPLGKSFHFSNLLSRPLLLFCILLEPQEIALALCETAYIPDQAAQS
jgi:hypothetical protein